MYYGRTFKIFAEKELDEVLGAKIQELQSEVNDKPDDYVLNVNETEFLNYLVGKYYLENFDIRFQEATVSTYEKSIPSESFPSFLFNVEPGQWYNKDVIRYHIPLTGDETLLHCRPNPCSHWSTDVTVRDGCLCFDIVNFYNDPQSIKQEASERISFIKRQLNYVVNQVNSYNSSLASRAQEIFQARKQHLLKKNNLIASLGIPLRKRENIPQTFAIPTPLTRKKIQVSPPIMNEKGYKPEPTLDAAIYQEILQVIHDVGKQFERMPSTYANKGEEALRDHFLLVLEPRFEGSATSETFNKAGKTDILLRYGNSNVFIAECKFWKGANAYLKTINQLLGYLTWRDSKSAVVMFVKNKEFSSVIKTVESETPKHPNYLNFVNKKEETWLSYQFHINGDPNREVKLTVLLFHTPPV